MSRTSGAVAQSLRKFLGLPANSQRWTKAWSLHFLAKVLQDHDFDDAALDENVADKVFGNPAFVGNDHHQARAPQGFFLLFQLFVQRRSFFDDVADGGVVAVVVDLKDDDDAGFRLYETASISRSVASILTRLDGKSPLAVSLRARSTLWGMTQSGPKLNLSCGKRSFMRQRYENRRRKIKRVCEF
jgi:hypothetical protein